MKLYVCVIESYTDFRTIVSAGVLAVLLLACVGMATGATWVVDGAGGAGVNYTTIQAAVNASSAGDMIEVRGGTYVENVNVNKRLTLQGESADVVTVRAEDISDHVFEVTADYVNISGFTATGAVTPYAIKAGFYLGGAHHCNISNNDASESLVGIYLNSASNNTLSSNNASGNDLDGIFLSSSNNNTLTNNNASSNLGGGGCGIRMDSSSNNTLTNNTLLESQFGIELDSSSNNTLTNNKVLENNYDGIRLLFSSSSNTLTNNTVLENNRYGILLLGSLPYSSNNNTLSGNTVSDNAWSDLRIMNSESAFRDNTLSGTTISFTYEGDMSLKGVGSPAPDPAGWNTIGKFINVTNQSAGAWIFLNFSYSGSDLSGLDESSLKVWKHNGTTWVEDGWNGTRYLDTEDDVIGVNITSFSVFAPAAPPGITCDCGNICVNQTGWWRDGSAFNVNGTPIQAAIDSATDGDTICVGAGSYTENVNVNKRLTLIGDGADVVTVRAEDISDHVFEVTADYVNISGFTVTGATGTDKAGICISGQHRNISDNIVSNNSRGIESEYLNLLTNPGAETGDMSGWTIIANGGIGWSTRGSGYEGNHSFSTSYAWCNRSQEVDLLAKGYTNAQLDATPPVNVGEWFAGYGSEWDDPRHHSDYCYLKVELRDENHTVIDSYDSGVFQTIAGSGWYGPWEQRSHIFSGYGSGLRYVYFEDGGKDWEYWYGHYGPALDAAFVGFGNVGNVGHNTITNNTLTNNGRGICLSSSSDNDITNNTASNNGYGIYLYSSSSNMLSSNTVLENQCGIELSSSNYNVLTNNKVLENNYDGIRLYSSSNNTLTNNTASNNTWDLYVEGSESAFRDNTLSGTTISFTYEGDVSLKGVGSPAADPAGWNTIGKFISATDQSAGAWIFLNFSYSGSDLSGLDESSLKVWKHNGTTWIEDGWNGTRYLDVGNVIGVNITSFSVFAPAAPISYGDIYVDENGWWHDDGVHNASTTPIQAAVDNATAGDVICAKAGSYTENVNVNKRLTLIGDGADVVTVRAEDVSDHVFEVTADYVTISGFTVSGATGTDKAGICLASGVDHCNLSSNNITNNSEGIHLSPTASGNVINFNNIVSNIVSNSPYGVYNKNVSETVNAENNWWGDVSGPSGAGNGTGDAISAHVDYDPWLDSPYPEGRSIYFTNATETTVNGTTEIDAREVADTNVTISTTAPVNVTIGNYSRNPGPVFDGNVENYIDVHVNDTINVSWIQIRLYYTDDEITDLYEDALRLYWLNGSAWEECLDSKVVNTTDVDNYSGYVWANISNDTTPNLSAFDGLPLIACGKKRPLPLAQRSRSAGSYPSLTSKHTLAPSPVATSTPGPSPTPTPAPSPRVTPTESPSPTQTSSFPTNPIPAVPSKISVILIAAVYLVLRRKAG